MKEVSEIKYECEFCHNKYKEKEKAEKCENSHKGSGIMNARGIYRSFEKYPFRISVTFEEGEKAIYTKGEYSV